MNSGKPSVTHRCCQQLASADRMIPSQFCSICQRKHKGSVNYGLVRSVWLWSEWVSWCWELHPAGESLYSDCPRSIWRDLRHVPAALNACHQPIKVYLPPQLSCPMVEGQREDNRTCTECHATERVQWRVPSPVQIHLKAPSLVWVQFETFLEHVVRFETI